MEPLRKTPSSGSYSYDLLSQNSPLRKALYYLNGGYGYDKVVKDKYFSGWSDDNSYVIGHLVVAYIYAGNSADTGAFHGAPQSYIDKALEVASAIQGLPNPPEGFRAFIVPGQGSQTIAGSWYQVPNGWIELKKSSAKDVYKRQVPDLPTWTASSWRFRVTITAPAISTGQWNVTAVIPKKTPLLIRI